MPDFPACSNLCKNVTSVIIGEKYRNLLEAPLNKLSIDVFLLPDNPLVDRRLSGHADLSVFYSGYDTIFLAPYLRETLFAEMIENLGLKIEFLDIVKSNFNNFKYSKNFGIIDFNDICDHGFARILINK